MSASSDKRRRSIYLTPALTAAIGALGRPLTLTGRLTVIADRYQEILARTRIEQRFSADEWAAICSIVIRLPHEPAAAIRGLAVSVGDILPHEQFVDPWPIDVDQLLAKLRGLTYVEEVAVVEFAERVWLARHQEDPGA